MQIHLNLIQGLSMDSPISHNPFQLYVPVVLQIAFSFMVEMLKW